MRDLSLETALEATKGFICSVTDLFYTTGFVPILLTLRERKFKTAILKLTRLFFVRESCEIKH